jgi:hypothetical protein
MFGLRMFASMLLIDGAVLFVLYGVIAVLGTEHAGIGSFLPAVLTVTAGALVRPRPRRVRESPRVEVEVGRYR